MGGRDVSGSGSTEDRLPEREEWIREVSDARLDRYDRLMDSISAPYRSDGQKRIDSGSYFRDLVDNEKRRRGR